ncbi:MAG: hypothetical protein QM756_05390 [Polyangiaceae bacterium]
MRAHFRVWQTLASCSLALACQSSPKAAAAPPPSAPAPVASVAAPSPPAPEAPPERFRTGNVAPMLHDTPRRLEVVGRVSDGAFEILELALPPYDSVIDVPKDTMYPPDWMPHTPVRLTPDDGFAFIGDALDYREQVREYDAKFRRSGQPNRGPTYRQPKPPAARLWLRRLASKELPSGVLFVAAQRGEPGHRVTFHVESLPASAGANDKAGRERAKNFAAAASRFFTTRPGAFYAFASQRVRSRSVAGGSGALRADRDNGETDLRDLMGMTSGRQSVQAALEHQRPLYLAASRAKPSIPIEKVPQPSLARHPWAEMLSALRTPPREEPLARATPAEFYFVRAKSFGKFLDLLDWVSDFGQPAADLLDTHTSERGSVARYQDELGLERSGLARVFGPSIIDDVAIVGSDPYVHEGSDVTLLFRVKSSTAFEAGLAAAIAARATGHGELTQSSFDHEGVKVAVTRSADGRVRRHRASLNGLELVSNSPNALRRVLSTLKGKHPALADEPDFQYLLARERDVANDAFVYIGDSFVGAVTGPAQKIAEARRQIALAELSTPGYAALLAGWFDGRAPATQKALLDAKWLSPAELKHGGGAPIRFEPGNSASSEWGSVAYLEPLIDRPAVVKVTREESRAYETFQNYYTNYWSDRIDPIALSLRLDDSADMHTLSAELRVLPLLRREYQEWIGLVGNAHVSPYELSSGARIVAALGKDARVRDLLDGFGRDIIGSDKLRFDWLGDYVMLGVGNRNEGANAALQLVREKLERPERGRSARPDWSEETMFSIPVYGVVALRSSVAAGIALALLQQKVKESSRGLSWSDAAAYRGNDVVKVSGRHGRIAVAYYTLLPEAFAISTNEATLHEVVDQLLDHPPKTVEGGAGATQRLPGQLVFELSGEKQSALMRVLGWFAQAELLSQQDASSAEADAVLRGEPQARNAPERLRQLMRAYLGSVALTPDGRYYEAAPEGARDPVRGSAFAPAYPDVPVPGSPLERVLSGLRALRSEQSYEPEPGHTQAQPLQSLHVVLSIKTQRAEKR